MYLTAQDLKEVLFAGERTDSTYTRTRVCAHTQTELSSAPAELQCSFPLRYRGKSIGVLKEQGEHTSAENLKVGF